MKKLFFYIFAIHVLSIEAQAELQPVKIEFDNSIPKVTWMFDGNIKKVKPQYRPLAYLKKNSLEGNYSKCIKYAAQSMKKHRLLLGWILNLKAECALRAIQHNKNISIKSLKALVKEIKKRDSLLRMGGHAQKLRQTYIDLSIELFSKYLKKSARYAWGHTDVLLDEVEIMNSEQKAKAFRLISEMSFLLQNLETAKQYTEKSLKQKESSELREKLLAIESLLKKSKQKEKQEEVLDSTFEYELDEVVERIRNELKAGNLIPAMQDSINVIKKYPGSIQARWAVDRVYDIYLKFSEKRDIKYDLLKRRVLANMKEVDGERLRQWALEMFWDGQYSDAAQLAEEALGQRTTSHFNTELLFLLGRSYLLSQDLNRAKKPFNILVQKHQGTDEYKGALFYLGLIAVMQSKDSKALAHFEKLMVLKDLLNYELSTRYWMWRVLQKTDKDRAEKVRLELVEKYPITYYGLRAQAEANGKTFNLEGWKENQKFKGQIWFSDRERTIWKNFLTLSSAGLYAEAWVESAQLPSAEDLDAQMALASYFAKSFAFPQAIQIVNQVWDQKPNYKGLDTLKLIFPQEFQSEIEKSSKRYGLSPYLVKSLIRQESAFNFRAVSRSQALGLMQLIPPTAQEVAHELRFKNLKLPDDMFKPNNNIRFGTYYLSKVLKQFDGNVPAALAGYNAGPHRMKKFFNAMGVSLRPTSKPEEEVWLDLMPWGETRFYVKAILRNWIVYQAIEKSRVTLEDPIWKSAVL